MLKKRKVEKNWLNYNLYISFKTKPNSQMDPAYIETLPIEDYNNNNNYNHFYMKAAQIIFQLQ